MPSLASSLRPVAIAAGLALCGLLAARAAQAQGADAVRLVGAPGQSGGTVGLALLSGARYPGSDERRTQALPVVDYQWANGFFAGVGNGIGYNFSRQPGLQYGARVTVDFGRSESRSNALRGMGDVNTRAEIGGFLNYAIAPALQLSSSLRYGAGVGGQGLQLHLGAGTSFELAPQWRLGLGLATHWANSDYLQTYFGVTPAQSAASGYAVYRPRAGLRDVRANLSLNFRPAPRWAVTAGISAVTLLGDAKDSPLTRRASSVNGLLAGVYAF